MTKQSSSHINLRNLVLDMLLEIDRGAKSHIILKNTLDSHKELDKQETAFITRLYQGILERRIELDYITNQFSKTKVNKMKPVIRHILRMAVYQLKYMDSIPESAVCNEAVKLADKRKFVGLKGFVNGVTRNIARNISNINYPEEYIERLSIIYSVPEWIIEMWMEQYGKSCTETMLNSLYNCNDTTVRCNTSKADVEDIIQNLRYNHVTVEQSDVMKECLYLSGYDKLSNLDVFQAGMITVQDLSSMLVGIIANPKPDNYVIDVCAAPGGKSLHIAELMEIGKESASKSGFSKVSGVVEARDVSEYKVSLIQENIDRTGYKNIRTKVADATVLDEESVEKADIVIADLPCSGLGVISKKSDIKYNVSREQIFELVKLQRKILSVVSRYVKPGGKLIFSTCTVNKYENDENVKWIEENLPFKLAQIETLPHINCEKGFIQIFPGTMKLDGFFISSFVRD